MGIILSAVVLAVCGVWFWSNDRKLPKNAQALEWIPSPAKAEAVGRTYSEADRGRVARALVVDSLIFVPAYITFFAQFQKGDAMVIALIVAGVLDWIENAGIWAEVRYGKYGLAPLVAFCAYTKWAIVIASIIAPIWRYYTVTPR